MLIQWQRISAYGLAGAFGHYGGSAAGRRCTSPNTLAFGSVYISQLEHGKKEPGLRTIEILALGFDMTPAQLFRGIGAPLAAD